MQNNSPWVIISRETTTTSTKGTTSTQAHTGNTVRTTTVRETGSKTVKVNDGNEITTATNTKGDTLETRSVTGDGTGSISGSSQTDTTTTSSKEGEGIVIKFSIPIQQKNPVRLADEPIT